MSADPEARFLRVLAEHGAALRRLTAGYERDPARRQDLEQDIHLALWQALPAFAHQCSERTFVFRVAHNRAITHVRHWSRRSVEPIDDETPLPDRGADPEQAASRSEQRAALAAAIRTLPLSLRQVILLVLEGLSHREIAGVLGISENNVAVRVLRARRAVSDVMSGVKEPR